MKNKPFKNKHTDNHFSHHNNDHNGHRHHDRQNHEHTSMPAKKKQFGQHFLRKPSVVEHMIEKVHITPETSILEIGCGDGFLTRAILTLSPCKHLLVYEIDNEWADFVQQNVIDNRLTILRENVLDADFSSLQSQTPWIILANLPYQITFPILFLIQRNKHLFSEGVVMVQEEVAQKIVSTGGRGFSTTTLFLQHHFDWQLLEKIEPGAFTPPPKVFSRLLHFRPKTDLVAIPNEEQFWKFIKASFMFPRQTLKNNLRSSHFDWQRLDEKTLLLRAQQMNFQQFLQLWQQLHSGTNPQ